MFAQSVPYLIKHKLRRAAAPLLQERSMVVVQNNLKGQRSSECLGWFAEEETINTLGKTGGATVLPKRVSRDRQKNPLKNNKCQKKMCIDKRAIDIVQ
jgi:hypothetical protein